MRKVYIEYLRFLAVIAVITIHVSVSYYNKFGEIGYLEWWLSNILNSASRFAVPVFVMVSGAVLLGRNISTVEFYKKRAIRLLPPIFFWNLFFIGYAVFNGMNIDSLVWFLKVGLFADGRAAGHLWYLSMFICLMMFAPFINQYLNGEKPSFNDLLIMLILMFAFMLMNWVSSFAKEIHGINITWFLVFPWYFAYFIAGYYIDTYESKITIKSSYLLVMIIVLTALGAVLNYFAVASLHIVKDYFILPNDGPLVFLTSMLIFLLARKSSIFSRERGTISKVSEASFGIYLIHPIIIGEMKKAFPSYDSNGLIYMPLMIILTFIVSFLFISAFRKIHFMRKLC